MLPRPLPALFRFALSPLALATLLAPAASAQAAPPPAPPGPSSPRAEAPPAPTMHGELALGLADAIRMGLENNLDVQVDRYGPFIAWEETRVAWGAYDPEWFSEFSYEDRETPNATVFEQGGSDSVKVDTVGGFGGLRGTLPMAGTSYDMRFGSDRNETASNIQTLVPEYNSSWSVSATQPLVRNLIWNEPWTRVKTTGYSYESSLEQFRREVMDVVQRIQDAYWELIAADDQVRVAEKSLETARALLEQTRTQFEVGVVSKVEVVEAEAGVAQRDFELIRARNRYQNSQDGLIDLTLGTGLRADSTLQIRPTDRPDDYVPYEIDRKAAVGMAFEYRPELQEADREIARREVQLKFAKNQRLPQLDARVSYGNEGLAGVLDPNCVGFGGAPCTTTVGRRWPDSLDDFFTNDAKAQLRVGALFSIPIPNTAARARASQAELELRRSHSQRRRLEQEIILEVRTAIRNLEDAQQGIEAARRATAAAEEQLRAERIRLEYGESTPFDVLLRESDYVSASSEEIRAFQLYRSSATALDRAQGTILRNNNVAIDAVRALR